MAKVIPQILLQSSTDARYDHEAMDSLPARELINFDPLIEESTPSRPMHPRSVLPSRIAIVGNYLPRKCGIATFTTDLCDAIHAEFQATELLALPVNDTEEGYSYPARVRFELSEDKMASYRQASATLTWFAYSTSTEFSVDQPGRTS